MLKQLPARLHFFVDTICNLFVGVMVAVALLALYRGDAELPWGILAGLFGGALLAAIFRDVPERILQRRDEISVREDGPASATTPPPS